MLTRLRPRGARAAKSVNFCSCQPRYKVAGAGGQVYAVNDGGCVRNTSTGLAHCQVITSTCVTPVSPNAAGEFWDVCLNTGAPRGLSIRISGVVGLFGFGEEG